MKYENYMMKKIVVLSLGLIGINAFAQTEEIIISQPVNKKSSVTSVQTNSSGSVTYVGEKPSDQAPISGYANDLPVIVVLKQITPNGWVVKKDDSNGKVDVNKHVSWTGGKTWNETLETVCVTGGMNAKVDWNTKVVTLTNSKQQANSKKSMFVLEGSESNQANEEVVSVVKTSPNKEKVVEKITVTDPNATKKEEIVVEQKVETIKVSEQGKKPKIEEKVVTEVKPVLQPIKPIQQTYTLNGAKTLKENVAIWASKNGYRLVWTGEDYPVVDSQIVAGDFEADNGPISELAHDYGIESRVQVPLTFVFYKNKTLVVENMSYEQSAYPRYNK